MTLSKQKGNSFERKISNALSARFAEYLGIESGFRRNIDSGSFFGASNQKRIETHLTESVTFGDIMTPSNFRFAIECKHYKTAPSFSSMAKQEYKLFDTWIEQASQDARNADKEMLVIAKFNGIPEFVIVQGIDPRAFAIYKGHSLVRLDTWLEGEIANYFVE